MALFIDNETCMCAKKRKKKQENFIGPLPHALRAKRKQNKKITKSYILQMGKRLEA